MKVIITTFGTRGDFEPFFALAQELAAHRHEPVFAVPSFAAEMLKEAGFRYVVIASEMPDLRDRVNLLWSTQAESYTSGSALLQELAQLRKYFPHVLEELTEVCSGASVLVSGPAQPLARVVHDVTGIPFVSVQVSHFGGNGGPALSDAGHQLVNSFRQELGLAPIKNPFTTGANSPQLALYAMSTSLNKRSPDWPRHYHMTGYFFRSHSSMSDSALLEFLDAGPPPVVVSFGSMPHDRPEELRDLVVEALRSCGCRAVLQGLPSGPGDRLWNPKIYWAGSIPHTLLFPRAACVVTHGGAGTAAAVFRAGVPAVFVPHGDVYDQRYWAQLAQEFHCSPGAIQYSDLSPEKLAAAIRSSIDDPLLRARARDLAERIGRENGVRTARQLIENLVRNVGLD